MHGGMEIAELFVAQAEETDWHSAAGIHTLTGHTSPPKYFSEMEDDIISFASCASCPISFPGSEV